MAEVKEQMVCANAKVKERKVAVAARTEDPDAKVDEWKAGAVGADAKVKEVSVAARTDPLANWECPQREECPICFLPLPIDRKELSYLPCCGQPLCDGCLLGIKETRVCPFCRDVIILATDAEMMKKFNLNLQRQANRGRSVAMCRIARRHFRGNCGFSQNKAEGINYDKSVKKDGSIEPVYWHMPLLPWGIDPEADLDAFMYNYQSLESARGRVSWPKKHSFAARHSSGEDKGRLIEMTARLTEESLPPGTYPRYIFFDVESVASPAYHKQGIRSVFNDDTAKFVLENYHKLVIDRIIEVASKVVLGGDAPAKVYYRAYDDSPSFEEFKRVVDAGEHEQVLVILPHSSSICNKLFRAHMEAKLARWDKGLTIIGIRALDDPNYRCTVRPRLLRRELRTLQGLHRRSVRGEYTWWSDHRCEDA